MKKISILLLFFGSILIASAAVHPPIVIPFTGKYASTTIANNVGTLIPTFTQSDTVTKYTSSSVLIYPNADKPYRYAIAYQVDSVSGGNSISDSICLQSKMYNSLNFNTISAVKWRGHRTSGLATPDTIVYFDIISGTSINNRVLRLLIKPTGTGVHVVKPVGLEVRIVVP